MYAISRPAVLTLQSLIPNGREVVDGVVRGAYLHKCQCETGYFGPAGRTCSACSAGTYTEQIGQTACLPCSAGSSCDCRSATSKLRCETSNTIAACWKCQYCGAGRYQNDESQGNCKPCPTGFDCSAGGMTFPIAGPGTWISPDNRMSIHDCAVAGHMPQACPGGNISDVSLEYCYKGSRHALSDPSLTDECTAVVGAKCTDGYWGPGCAKCCKRNKHCEHLEARGMSLLWYKDDEQGLCIECPEQNPLEIAVVGVVILWVAEKASQFSEIAKLSGELHAPVISLITFFQLCVQWRPFSNTRAQELLNLKLWCHCAGAIFSRTFICAGRPQ